jgi:transcriptional regulator GlxA family with amidase domain
MNMAETKAAGKTVAILINPGVSMLELTGIYSTLNGLKMAKYDVWIVAESSAPLQSDTPLKVVPQKQFSEVPDPDILAVVGGGLSSLQEIGSNIMADYIFSASERAESIIGYGTGSLVLAACGLLKDRRAATHWAYAGLLEAFGARYSPDRWVDDGKLITTAGGTAGMDMNLRLLARIAGEKNARMLQLFAEYEPEPPFGGIDWSQVKRNGQAHFQPNELQAFTQSLAASRSTEAGRNPDIIRVLLDWAEGIVQPETPQENSNVR